MALQVPSKQRQNGSVESCTGSVVVALPPNERSTQRTTNEQRTTNNEQSVGDEHLKNFDTSTFDGRRSFDNN